MRDCLKVMRESIKEGLSPDKRSASGMAGGNACLMLDSVKKGEIEDTIYARAAAYALAVTETNACMGRIVAAPTAGASEYCRGAYCCCGEEKLRR